MTAPKRREMENVVELSKEEKKEITRRISLLNRYCVECVKLLQVIQRIENTSPQIRGRSPVLRLRSTIDRLIKWQQKPENIKIGDLAYQIRQLWDEGRGIRSYANVFQLYHNQELINPKSVKDYNEVLRRVSWIYRKLEKPLLTNMSKVYSILTKGRYF